MKRGVAVLRWKTLSRVRFPDAGIAPWQPCTRRANCRRRSHRTSTTCIRCQGINASDVIELHGNTTYARCIGCQARYELSWVKEMFDRDQRAPDCQICDAPVKTATISFGQAMPEDEMRRATVLAQNADLFLAIGSSLVVWPAAGIPVLAKRAGAKLVIINNEATDLDDVADLVIRFDIGETLSPFIGN